ncbi:MAG: LapA family protein, partial [Deltaproteobacteria bacterium]
FTTADITLYEIIIVTYLLGVLSIGLYGIAERFRLKKRIKVLTRTLEEREKEVNGLRNLPITSDHVPPSGPDAA